MTFIRTSRDRARLRGDITYPGKRCWWDGSFERYVISGKCVECARYHHAIDAKRILGKEGMGKIKTPAVSWHDEAYWTEERRAEHAERIKKGRARKKITLTISTVPPIT